MKIQATVTERKASNTALINIFKYGRRYSLYSIGVFIIGAVSYFAVQRNFYLTEIEKLRSNVSLMENQLTPY
ncbi:MAG TPA: hypothetical protein VHA33_09660 [Candidatus Angelobacter sp.]|jgi:hypothetical protein|nr:hypothetical protein [Candidatus Angelobacter sp.]